MERATHARLIERLRSSAGWAGCAEPPVSIAADRYRDPARLERERAALFATTPRAIAASSAIAPGACVPVDLPDAAVLLARGEDGVLTGMTNACRHRATRLVDVPCTPKALVCPYHGWTYDLRGRCAQRLGGRPFARPGGAGLGCGGAPHATSTPSATTVRMRRQRAAAVALTVIPSRAPPSPSPGTPRRRP